MNRYILFIAWFCAMLCTNGAYAQTAVPVENRQKVITIEEMFSLAEENSLALRPGKTAVEETSQAIKSAKNARLPEIEASVSVSYLGNGTMWDRNFSNKMEAPMPHFGNNFSVEASQVIYSGGAISNSIHLAKLQNENARWGLEESRDKVRFMLVGYYLDLYKLQNIAKVYTQNIAQTRQVLNELRAKEKEGVVLQNDITRYELLLADLELQLTRLQNNMTIANRNLVVTLGLPHDTQIMPDTTLINNEVSIAGEADWAHKALENSPVLKQSALTIEIEKRQEKIVRSERIPKIALFAGDKLDGPVVIEVPPLDNNFNYWYVGIGVKYNLDALYKTQRNLSRSKMAIQRSREAHDYAREQTELAISAEYVKFVECFQTLQTREKNVELAHSNYDVIHNRYLNEMTLLTDMLDATNAKLASEVELVNARIDIHFNYYKLRYISGTL